MAQKKRPAARAAVKGKPSAPKSSSKKTAPAKVSAKAAPKKSAAPVKAASKPKIKTPTPKVTPPAKTKSSPRATAPDLARAKSALRAQSDASAPTSVEAAPKVKAKKPLSARAEKARARKISIEINANEAASALAAKWSSLFKRSENIEAQPYNMKAVFEERTAIVHKVLGWGYILANRNDRLEVLFKDGIKYLISNYKP